jgi:hypothetical protein
VHALKLSIDVAHAISRLEINEFDSRFLAKDPEWIVDVQLLQSSPRHMLPRRSRPHSHLTEIDSRSEILRHRESLAD